MAESTLPVVEELLTSGVPIEEGLRLAIERLDAMLDRIAVGDKQRRSGTTATLAVVDEKNHTITTCQVGDSRAFLCREGELVTIAPEHRLDDPSEVQRIRDVGGRISYRGIGRVNGELAMSRAIGVFHLREAGIISEPAITMLQYDEHDAFLLLASDGLTDTLTLDEIYTCCADAASPGEAAQSIGELALSFGATDNVTLVIKSLPGWDKGRFKKAKQSILQRNLTRRAS